MMKATLTFFSLIFVFPVTIYSQDGGSRTTDMMLDWRNTRSKVGTSFSNEEARKLFMDINSGPYLENKWFEGSITTSRGETVHEKLKFRYDILYHNVHYTSDAEGEVLQFPTELIESFEFFDEDQSRYFIRLEKGQLPPSVIQCTFAELIFKGNVFDNDIQLVRVHIGEELTYTPKPPVGDGVPRKSYGKREKLFYKIGVDSFSELRKLNSKSLVKEFPFMKEGLSSYQKKYGKIASEADVQKFLKENLK